MGLQSAGNLKNRCARIVFDQAIADAKGKAYWLGVRDCQSWANNVERSMCKNCEDTCCSEKGSIRRSTWKHSGFRLISIGKGGVPIP